MSEIEELTEKEIRDMGPKEFRKTFPSGWMEVSRCETLVLLIDALLESNPTREFTAGELADKAGTTRKSVNNHIDSLVRLGVVKRLSDRSTDRYTLNEKSPITQKLFELNLTVEQVKNNELPQTLSRDHLPSVDEGTKTSIQRLGSEKKEDDSPVEPRGGLDWESEV